MFGFSGIAGSHIRNWFWDNIGDTISNIGDTIDEMFDNMGHYCVEWANAALEAYQNLTSSASKILQADVDSGIFHDFWTIINKVSSVLCIIASSLIVLFFLTKLCSETWETRHELDIWSLVKDLMLLIVSVVVVNHALWFVKMIFSSGAKLAMLVTLSNADITDNLGLTTTNATYLADGVSGLRGLFIFIVYLLAALVVVICGVLITMEIYKRVFKIYILIPFASLSFSTFVIGSQHSGGEVFSGYVKNIIQTALEGIVIMMLLFFSYSLVSSGKMMKVLFPTYNQFDVIKTEARNEHELAAINAYITEYAEQPSIQKKYKFSEYFKNNCEQLSSGYLLLTTYAGIDLDYSKVSPELLDLLDNADIDKINKVEGDYESNIFRLNKEAVKRISEQIGKKANSPVVEITIYPKCSAVDALMIMLQMVFPICLCAGAIKMADTYSGMILGR